ncbi:hypothetical protein ACA910_014721 [Epithemia clementina (nom. ined.)]
MVFFRKRKDRLKRIIAAKQKATIQKRNDQQEFKEAKEITVATENIEARERNDDVAEDMEPTNETEREERKEEYESNKNWTNAITELHRVPSMRLQAFSSPDTVEVELARVARDLGGGTSSGTVQRRKWSLTGASAATNFMASCGPVPFKNATGFRRKAHAQQSRDDDDGGGGADDADEQHDLSNDAQERLGSTARDREHSRVLITTESTYKEEVAIEVTNETPSQQANDNRDCSLPALPLHSELPPLPSKAKPVFPALQKRFHPPPLAPRKKASAENQKRTPSPSFLVKLKDGWDEKKLISPYPSSDRNIDADFSEQQNGTQPSCLTANSTGTSNEREAGSQQPPLTIGIPPYTHSSQRRKSLSPLSFSVSKSSTHDVVTVASEKKTSTSMNNAIKLKRTRSAPNLLLLKTNAYRLKRPSVEPVAFASDNSVQASTGDAGSRISQLSDNTSLTRRWSLGRRSSMDPLQEAMKNLEPVVLPMRESPYTIQGSWGSKRSQRSSTPTPSSSPIKIYPPQSMENSERGKDLAIAVAVAVLNPSTTNQASLEGTTINTQQQSSLMRSARPETAAHALNIEGRSLIDQTLSGEDSAFLEGSQMSQTPGLEQGHSIGTNQHSHYSNGRFKSITGMQRSKGRKQTKEKSSTYISKLEKRSPDFFFDDADYIATTFHRKLPAVEVAAERDTAGAGEDTSADAESWDDIYTDESRTISEDGFSTDQSTADGHNAIYRLTNETFKMIPVCSPAAELSASNMRKLNQRNYYLTDQSNFDQNMGDQRKTDKSDTAQKRNTEDDKDQTRRTEDWKKTDRRRDAEIDEYNDYYDEADDIRDTGDMKKKTNSNDKNNDNNKSSRRREKNNLACLEEIDSSFSDQEEREDWSSPWRIAMSNSFSVDGEKDAFELWWKKHGKKGPSAAAAAAFSLTSLAWKNNFRIPFPTRSDEMYSTSAQQKQQAAIMERTLSKNHKKKKRTAWSSPSPPPPPTTGNNRRMDPSAARYKTASPVNSYHGLQRENHSSVHQANQPRYTPGQVTANQTERQPSSRSTSASPSSSSRSVMGSNRSSPVSRTMIPMKPGTLSTGNRRKSISSSSSLAYGDSANMRSDILDDGMRRILDDGRDDSSSRRSSMDSTPSFSLSTNHSCTESRSESPSLTPKSTNVRPWRRDKYLKDESYSYSYSYSSASTAQKIIGPPSVKPSTTTGATTGRKKASPAMFLSMEL